MTERAAEKRQPERLIKRILANKGARWGLKIAAALGFTAGSYFMPEVNIPHVNLFNRAVATVSSLESEPVLEILDHSRIPDQLYYERWGLKAVGPTDAITPQIFLRLVSTKDNTVPAKLILWTEISKKGPAKVCVNTYQKPQTCEEILGTEKNISWYPIDTGSLKNPGDYIAVDSARLKVEGTGAVEIKMKITDDQGLGLLTSAEKTLILLGRQVNLPVIRKGVFLDPQTYLPYLQTFKLWERRQQKIAA